MYDNKPQGQRDKLSGLGVVILPYCHAAYANSAYLTEMNLASLEAEANGLA